MQSAAERRNARYEIETFLSASDGAWTAKALAAWLKLRLRTVQNALEAMRKQGRVSRLGAKRGALWGPPEPDGDTSAAAALVAAMAPRLDRGMT